MNSYDQAVKHSRNHSKDKKGQPVYFSTNCGFWPSRTWTEEYTEYRQECKALGAMPLSSEQLYNYEIEHKSNCTPLEYAKMTAAGKLP